MIGKSGKRLFGLLFLFLFASLTTQAASFSSIADGDWATAATWNCTASCAGEDGIPDADDSVTITSGRTVTVSGAQAIHILSMNSGGILSVNAGATLTTDGTTGSAISGFGTIAGAGTVRMQGTTSVTASGTYSAGFEVISGTTTGSGTFGGTFAILSGATLNGTNQTFTFNGDITVNAGGTMSNTSGIFNANANVTNNGTIAALGSFRFGGGARNLSGAGVFTGDYIIFGGSTETLTSAVTFGDGSTTTSFAVNSGGALDVGANTLTFNQANLSGSGSYTGAPGKIVLQGASSIAVNNFTAALEISGGTTTATGSTISGSLTILNGATFSHSNQTITHTGDLNVNAGGAITNTSGVYNFGGANLVNNGAINTPGQFNFNRSGGQSFSGAGMLIGDVTVISGSTVNLTSDIIIGNGLTASSLAVNSGGTLAVGANTLTLNGVALSGAGAFTSAAAGKLRTQGTSSIAVGVAFTGSIEINSGTTTATGSIGGALTVLNGATFNLTNQNVTIEGDLTVNAGGTITKTSGTISANGTNIVNNGTIAGGSFAFGGGASQTFSGAGTLTASVSVISGTTVTLTSDVTIGNGVAATSLAVNSGGTLAVANNTLTLNGVAVSGLGAFTSGAGGKLRTQGASSLNVGAAFSGSLEINSGTTSVVSSTISGALSVLGGATLNITNQTITVNGNVTVNSGGTLTSSTSSGTFNFGGPNLINNGAISGMSFRFSAAGVQNLSGAGSISSGATIFSGSTVTLASNHQLSTLAVNAGGTLNTATFMLFLNGAGTPLSGAGALANVNVTYNGTAAQTVQAAASYNRLGINNAAGVTLSAPETVSNRLILTSGTFNNGANLTLADGATVERDAAFLQSAPTLQGTINLEYVGSGDALTQLEFPTSTTAVQNVTINKALPTNRVTLDGNRIINGALTLVNGQLWTIAFALSGGQQQIGGFSTLTIGAAGTSTGSTNSFVVGRLEKFFSAPAPFVYDVGTDTGYSPATINVDAGMGSFIVQAQNGVVPGSNLDPAKTLNRYWSLTNNGIIQADITFQYPQGDVPPTANENLFQFVRNEGGATNTRFLPSSLNTTNNVAVLNNVTQFSDWTLQDFGPTAAPANISGQVKRADGSPLAGVRVKLVNSTSQTIVKTTDNAGNYLFHEIRTGETYVMTAERRGFSFEPATRVLNHNSEVTDIDFTASRDTTRQEATAGSDFDGDGRADLAVFRPENGTWYLKRSSDNDVISQQFGQNGDVPAAGDYDGDGKSDFMVYRPADHVWYLLRSSDNAFSAQKFGASGDLAAAGDYDGDGKTDRAVYRANEGVWYIWQSASEQMRSERFGLPTDLIVPADYDGDGKTDVAVYRQSDGIWYILQSSDNQMRAERFGNSTDKPAPADFDGDGKTDLAVYRANEGVWHVLRSSNNSFTSIRWGASEDVTVPADYDGDGQADAAVFRKGNWHLLFSENGAQQSEKFGQENDKPIPNQF